MPRMKRDEDDRQIIAFNIRKRRKELFPSSSLAAEKAKVKHSQWSTWETGSRTPTMDNLKIIAATLECSVDALQKQPENWDQEKAAFMAERRKDKSNSVVLPTIPDGNDDIANASSDSIQQGINDYMQIISVLAQVQAKHDRGDIDTRIFNKKMQMIKEFIHFEYRKILPEQQIQE